MSANENVMNKCKACGCRYRSVHPMPCPSCGACRYVPPEEQRTIDPLAERDFHPPKAQVDASGKAALDALDALAKHGATPGAKSVADVEKGIEAMQREVREGVERTAIEGAQNGEEPDVVDQLRSLAAGLSYNAAGTNEPIIKHALLRAAGVIGKMRGQALLAESANRGLLTQNHMLLAQNDALRKDLEASRDEAQQFRKQYDAACKTIADMHSAAVGCVRGPNKGLVEDVAALRKVCDDFEKALERMKASRDRWMHSAKALLERERKHEDIIEKVKEALRDAQS